MRGYPINVGTGSTKYGKTVLCNHVLNETGDSVTIEGGQVKSEDDFWDQIAYTLDLGLRERANLLERTPRAMRLA